MKRYAVTAEVTISLHTSVEAESEEQARELAMDRDLCAIWDQADPKREWATSGELDGEPRILEVEESDGGGA